MRWWNIFVLFTAPNQSTLIAWGTLAAYSLIVVTVSSLNIKKMPHRQWWLLHYGSCAVLGLGLIHVLAISNKFAKYKPFRIEEPDKFLLAFVALAFMVLPFVVLFPRWRIAATRRLSAKNAS